MLDPFQLLKAFKRGPFPISGPAWSASSFGVSWTVMSP
jgi:hypothetical protein